MNLLTESLLWILEMKRTVLAWSSPTQYTLFLRDVQESIVEKMRSITDYVFIDSMDHLNFVWGLDANQLVYHHILGKLRSLTSNGNG